LISIKDAGSIGVKAVAATELPASTKLSVFGDPVPGPTMYTVCCGEDHHSNPIMGTQYISHACRDTNTRVEIDEVAQTATFVLKSSVAEGEDFTFNYNSTEYTMSSPFHCQCSACIAEGKSRWVAGFSEMDPEDRAELLASGDVSTYVLHKASADGLLRTNAEEGSIDSPSQSRNRPRSSSKSSLSGVVSLKGSRQRKISS
tara:strand:- start:1078 stop:1680 length:603 start_codon:yes stop_codon:yes gene_type:complete